MEETFPTSQIILHDPEHDKHSFRKRNKYPKPDQIYDLIFFIHMFSEMKKYVLSV